MEHEGFEARPTWLMVFGLRLFLAGSLAPESAEVLLALRHAQATTPLPQGPVLQALSTRLSGSVWAASQVCGC